MTTPPTLPPARVPDPASAPPIRWGVVAPGGIAGSFAAAVAGGTASQVVAVGSRSTARAEEFAGRHGVEHAYGSYEQLVADPDVDAVYVASPHSEHRAHALLALEAGKSVLVEKSFARNEAEGREVLERARDLGLLAAEAMWSRYLPHYDVVAQVVADGLLGEVVLLTADHSQPLWPEGPPRLADPGLGGGALLDLGVYPVSFADHVLGGPARVTASGVLTDRDVDATEVITLAYDGGELAVLTASMAAAGPCTAGVIGTTGRLELAGRFYAPTTVRLVVGDHVVESDARLPEGRHGFSYEAAEFARCLREGRTETVSMPHEATLRVLRTMDAVRERLGVRYPGED